MKNTAVGTRPLTVIILLFCFVLAESAIGPTTGFRIEPSSDRAEVIVDTDGGPVQGLEQDGSYVFRGIPYAQPPIGELRWTYPRACKVGDCWEGILKATNFGDMCTQMFAGTPVVMGSENCLFVNVWTPEVQPKKKRPVLFYIHGGDLTMGSGSIICPSAEFAKAMDIVAVSINYRLNAFGFLALDALALDSPSKTSGNYGFMDQILALRWVKNNVEKFGGDPERVTLLGQSSGGTSELALLVSPLAIGLFHGAVIMSSSPVFNKSSADAAKDNEVFLKKANCTSGSLADQKECIYRLSSEAVIHSVPWNEYPYWAMTDQYGFPTPGRFDGAIATVDGYVVPFPPIHGISHTNDVPIIFGNTAQETDISPLKDFSNSTLQEFESYTRAKLLKFMSSEDVEKALAMYVTKGSPRLYYSNMVSDMKLICPTDVFGINATTEFTSNVYRYIVTDWPSSPVTIPTMPSSHYAFHMWDLIALFGFPRDFIQFTPQKKDVRFMNDLRREIGYFIQAGKVESVAWKRFPENTGLFTDGGLKVVSNYHEEECKFWMSRGFSRTHGLIS